MKEKYVTYYVCEKCNKSYGTEDEAKDCESKEITQDKGAKIGDRVRVLTGEGGGEKGTIESISIQDKYWGHYAWERYWHTIGVNAKLDSYGSRFLTYDAYELTGV